MGWVYDPAKSDALIDRGVTLLLAALEVGPHIKPLREATGLPHTIINNGSFRLRQAMIWVGRECRYSWLSAYHQGLPEGIEGLTADACVAAEMDGSGEVWSTAREGRYSSRGKNWRSDVPLECGTTVSLSRHRRNGEQCQSCEDAAEQRHASWLERKARIKTQREMWLTERDTKVDLEKWSALLDDGAKGSSVWASISLDASFRWDETGTVTMYDRIAHGVDLREGHLVEWDDRTFDDAKPEIDTYVDAEQLLKRIGRPSFTDPLDIDHGGDLSRPILRRNRWKH